MCMMLRLIFPINVSYFTTLVQNHRNKNMSNNIKLQKVSDLKVNRAKTVLDCPAWISTPAICAIKLKVLCLTRCNWFELVEFFVRHKEIFSLNEINS